MSNQTILNLSQLTDVVKDLKKQNKVIVLTNGCFDIIHVGHIQSLTFAKAQGDILIVALNDDASVSRLKGNARPILPLKMRAEVVGALKPVDYVVAFSEDTANEVVRTVKPQIYVKSADYNIETTPEGLETLKYGGKLVSAQIVSGISTSYIISKICKAYTENSEV